jgi:hypothetical protein
MFAVRPFKGLTMTELAKVLFLLAVMWKGIIGAALRARTIRQTEMCNARINN